ncbi:hypothetical protein EIP91_010577 [Steccherinum ochraceum]|uniref:F-box domain-containing protein n=1 Tax=Steccherinum ochraceum TaxID=92696 RepID=A0A4R0RJF0_9APHY|nr:hypothetical protein EIP91_010577 [Steccherinum ochraceum]
MAVISRMSKPKVVFRRLIHRLSPALRAQPLPPLSSHHAHIQELSSDVIQHVMKYLLDDPQSLEACSLTCRAWREPAQQLIWRSIRMGDGDALHHFENIGFYNKLLASRIHDVCLHGPSTRYKCKKDRYISLFGFDHADADADAKPVQCWVNKIKSEFTECLPNVTSLRLNGFDEAKFLVDREFIESLALFESVERLEIDECCFSDETLWAIICSFSHLRHLSIYNYHNTGHTDYPYPPYSNNPAAEQAAGPITKFPFVYAPALVSLEVVATGENALSANYELYDTMFRLARTDTVNTLRSLTWLQRGGLILTDHGAIRSLKDFLRELTHLEWIKMYTDHGIPMFDMDPALEPLNLLTVQTCHWYDPAHDDFCQRARTVNGETFPNVVTLKLLIPGRLLRQADRNRYKKVREFIESKGTYPRLKKVDVYLACTESHAKSTKWFKQVFAGGKWHAKVVGSYLERREIHVALHFL